MNRTALPSDLRSGGDGDGVGVGVGTGATTDALAFTGANDEAGTVDALTSGVINLGRGAVAVAVGSAVIEVDELGGAEACGLCAAAPVPLALALALVAPAVSSVRFAPR